tara:strand:+ start:92646 stop:93086 length:441 start_codon:yes stop_codon:yes gene_type:complete
MIKHLLTTLIVSFLGFYSYNQTSNNVDISESQELTRLSYEDLDTLTKVYINEYYTESEKQQLLNLAKKLSGTNYMCSASFKILSPANYSLEEYLKIDIVNLSNHREYDEKVEYLEPNSGLTLLLDSHKEMRIKMGIYRDYNQRINN